MESSCKQPCTRVDELSQTFPNLTEDDLCQCQARIQDSTTGGGQGPIFDDGGGQGPQISKFPKIIRVPPPLCANRDLRFREAMGPPAPPCIRPWSMLSHSVRDRNVRDKSPIVVQGWSLLTESVILFLSSLLHWLRSGSGEFSTAPSESARRDWAFRAESNCWRSEAINISTACRRCSDFDLKAGHKTHCQPTGYKPGPYTGGQGGHGPPPEI